MLRRTHKHLECRKFFRDILHLTMQCGGARRMITRILAILSLLLLSAQLCAHHSRAEYDQDTWVEFEATVTQVQWRNPHLRFTVEREVDGEIEVWELEGQDANNVTRRGVPRNAIEPGMVVRLAGWPSSRQGQHLAVNNFLLPDGLEVIVRQNVQPRWSERYVGGGQWVVDESLEPSDGSAGIYRVWSRRFRGARGDLSAMEDPPLTEAGRIGRDSFDPNVDDPSLEACVARGMPDAMSAAGSLHPFEFVQDGEDILMRLESFDNVRRIHMDPGAGAEEQPFSPLGYSTGRWEGDTLVVTTTRIDWPTSRYFSPRIPQSREVELMERFTLIEDATQLAYDVTITDPVNLTEPVSVERYIVWGTRPGIEVLPYECARR